MKKIHAYAAQEEKGLLKPFDYEPSVLAQNEVEIAVTHCGICHSDIHLIDNDWLSSVYPLVPGHEIIGTITELGANVSNLKIGERVGLGWQCDACFNCTNCKNGDENLCSQKLPTALRHYGGCSNYVRANANFVIPIPESLSSENTAPLLCAGITVYSPLRDYIHSAEKTGCKIGVIGIGGLGHLALQFASAFGCEVTAFSSDPSKEMEAKQFGATHFINSNDDRALEKYRDSFDFILSTVNINLKWENYIGLLRSYGKLCFVGVSGNVVIPILPLIRGKKSICGSNIGSPQAIKEMLEFSAKHNIQAKTQLMSICEVNDAISLVRNNKARYRVVLKN